jgi:hypothetical protein
VRGEFGVRKWMQTAAGYNNTRPRRRVLLDELERAQAEMESLIAALDSGDSLVLIRHALEARRALTRCNRHLLSACVRRKAVDAAEGNVAALDELAQLFATMPRATCWRCRVAEKRESKE